MAQDPFGHLLEETMKYNKPKIPRKAKGRHGKYDTLFWRVWSKVWGL